MNKQLTIGYLYPEYMNIYGDTGNIIALKTRAEKRGINIIVKQISIDTVLNEISADIFFFGGGQDQQQVFISQDLQRIGSQIKELLEQGAVSLTICGGYQLLGRFYRPFSQDDLPGISFFSAETHASNVRMIGNCAIKLHEKLHENIRAIYSDYKIDIPQTLVGFENHSGQTKLDNDNDSIGTTLYGYGNNESKQFEGSWKNNSFGTYLHGSLLPKNPHFADYLIYKALEYKYKESQKLEQLDDTLEYQAHNDVLMKLHINQ